MKERLKALYQSVILTHNKSPLNFEKKENASYRLEAYNPVCGDKYQLFFEVENNQITDIHFHGYGCAISKAASSILTKHLQNKSLEEAYQICQLYQKHLEPDTLTSSEIVEDFEAFSAAQHFPGRAKCATLSWEEMERFLKLEVKN
ncbi:MAG: Fe-S cluster assembly sulfur transfer protein SufU [Bacteroidota bacterium]